MKTSPTDSAEVDFGNWIRRRIIFAFAGASVMSACVAIVLDAFPLTLLFGALAAFSLLLASFLGYLHFQFSTAGADLQSELWHLTQKHLQWDGVGRCLDVGTGNGSLAILLALQYPQAEITGIDAWGADWEYSELHCKKNARSCGLDQRCDFIQASATELPFPAGHFDAVASHFVFHEVSGVADKWQVVKEALRVLEPGGAFSFHDMFFDPKFYGQIDTRAILAQLGVSEVQLEKTTNLTNIPLLMRHSRVLGCAGILWGKK